MSSPFADEVDACLEAEREAARERGLKGNPEAALDRVVPEVVRVRGEFDERDQTEGGLAAVVAVEIDFALHDEIAEAGARFRLVGGAIAQAEMNVVSVGEIEFGVTR